MRVAIITESFPPDVNGINDTLRGDFDPERTGVAVGGTVAGLRAAGAQVLTMRLPDPGRCSVCRGRWPGR